MKLQKILLFLCFTLLLSLLSTAQQQKSSDCYSLIKSYNLSTLWHTGSNKKTDDSAEITLPEPLGFIGENYQRFYIHYLTVTKSATNPFQYNVAGKTKVKSNTCNFTGSITIVKAGIYKEQSDKQYKQGYVICAVLFKEDSTQPSTGFFKGVLITKFYLDEKKAIQYDDLLFGADGFFNNQCIATWTSYGTHKTKKVAWGDYRIPDSKALDIGDGEFTVNHKYMINGWATYITAWSGDPESAAAKKAQEAEAFPWWKQ